MRQNIGALLTAAGTLFLSVRTVAAGPGGESPYGAGRFAPDVQIGSRAWNASYPDFEGNAPPYLNDDDNNAGTMNLFTRDALERRARNFPLRLMPLGASITQGAQSSDDTGYRKLLRTQLRWKGWNVVNMVGSLQTGNNFKDNDHEGHGGWTINRVRTDAWPTAQKLKPNLVLVNVGTNDCDDNDASASGPDMEKLIDDIFLGVPDVTLIVSTLARSRDHGACAAAASQAYRDVVAKSKYAGKRLGLADFYNAHTLAEHISTADGKHPNDAGYRIFAAVWYDAITKIESKIQPAGAANPPIDDGATGGPNTCTKEAGDARGPVQSQAGSGHDDGIYVHSSVSRGALTSARIQKNNDPASVIDGIPSHMFFANIVVKNPNFERKDAMDDWIRVFHNPATNKNTYLYRQNNGGGNFGPETTFNVDLNCDTGPTYAFADFNDDGLDDFFCIRGGSAVSVALNRGGNPPTFQSIGQVVGTHAGFDAPDVRIADIDGDGRADYCLTQPNGDVTCSRNARGAQPDEYFWQGFSTANGVGGLVFDKKQGIPDKSGIVFGDINGDFRSDYMYISDSGSVETFINNRGWNAGIVPNWRDAGQTHGGQAGTSGLRNKIKFGRIYGSGRLDYIYLKEEATYVDVLVWENTGGGGTKLKADGNFYCDMRGTGADDYVWIYEDGHAAEINANIHSPPAWGHSTSISLNVPGPRVGIHLADWTGNGRCDVLVQNKATGALTLYENQFSNNALTFTNRGVVSGSGGWCTEGWGVGIFDRGMRLADIDGDKRADVLCLEKNGRVTGRLNKAGGLENVGQVKFSEGFDRANIRFADVEASGRADLIHLDKYTGAATVFKNNGHVAAGGSSFSWANRGVLYSPIDRGETMHFTNQGGLGRADLLHVLPVTNRAWTYFNECGGNGGDDTNPITDPGLPPFP
ncbi:carbohydrate esterase family 3 protein [Podospora didyma]|uniref:Carbohydrate esterase family 3 protein n=1 Tax=Podospora didyma TaxID=330526 RepID=A0AAE0KA25_9PEZI|nr:carbohydrate esterase family 3 protein [Podospora didyma]